MNRKHPIDKRRARNTRYPHGLRVGDLVALLVGGKLTGEIHRITEITEDTIWTSDTAEWSMMRSLTSPNTLGIGSWSTYDLTARIWPRGTERTALRITRATPELIERTERTEHVQDAQDRAVDSMLDLVDSYAGDRVQPSSLLR